MAMRSNDKGFTLIEVLMVIVILGIMGSGILIYFVGVASSPGDAITVQGVALAEEKMEAILADKKANGFNAIVSESAVSLISPFDRFTREVEVYCVQESDLDADSGTMPNCTDSDIRAKRVKVSVTWAGGGRADIVTVISNH